MRRLVMTCISTCVFALLPLAQPASAIVLFRADTRPPGIVFSEGFVAPGSNTNPLMHLSGTPCLGANGAAEWTTAYISLTERDEDITGYATYVYNVVPDDSAPRETKTYDVVRGLQNLRSGWQVYGLSLRHVDLATNLLGNTAIAGQHMALRVPPESIVSVDIYEYDTILNSSRFVRTELNPAFRAPTRSASRPIFSPDMIDGIRTGGHPSQIHTVGDPRGEATHGLCLLPSGACFERTPQRMLVRPTGLFPHRATCVVQPSSVPGGLFQQALQIVLD